VPQGLQVHSAIGKLVGPAKNITSSNRFFALQGHTDLLPDSGHDPGPAQPVPPARAPAPAPPLTIASACTYQPQPTINTSALSPPARQRFQTPSWPRGTLIKLTGTVSSLPARML